MGQVRAPARRRRASTWSCSLAIVAGAACSLTAVDPIKVTEYSIVLSAVALPLTYFPILVVANDPDYMGEHVQRPPWPTLLGTISLIIVAVAALAAIPFWR